MKKFSGVKGTVCDAAVNEDYESAMAFEKIRVGKTGVFMPHNLSVKYIPFEYIDNAFVRINEVNGKLCCGNATFYYYRLVLVHGGKEIIDYLTENESTVDAALAEIAKSDERITIGFNRE